MENWITRGVAIIVGLGALGLCWTLGVFASVPIAQGRLFAFDGVELRIVAVAFVGALAALWGTVHLFALADRERHPGFYRVLRAAMLVAAVVAVTAGVRWSSGRFVAGESGDRPGAAGPVQSE